MYLNVIVGESMMRENKIYHAPFSPASKTGIQLSQIGSGGWGGEKNIKMKQKGRFYCWSVRKESSQPSSSTSWKQCYRKIKYGSYEREDLVGNETEKLLL